MIIRGVSLSGRYGGMDFNGGMPRKNATREATSTLKAWLHEHIKNPYPTKGEKIMLAIITKMTLTQVRVSFDNVFRQSLVLVQLPFPARLFFFP